MHVNSGTGRRAYISTDTHRKKHNELRQREDGGGGGGRGGGQGDRSYNEISVS